MVKDHEAVGEIHKQVLMNNVFITINLLIVLCLKLKV